MRHIFRVLGFSILWVAMLLFVGRWLSDVGHLALHEGRLTVHAATNWSFLLLVFPHSILDPVLPSSLRVASLVLTALLWGAMLYFLYGWAVARWSSRDAAKPTA